MDHSDERCWYFLKAVEVRWGIIEVCGIGFRQHFGGHWISDSRALLCDVSVYIVVDSVTKGLRDELLETAVAIAMAGQYY